VPFPGVRVEDVLAHPAAYHGRQLPAEVRPATACLDRREIQTEIMLGLADGHALPHRGVQRLPLRPVVRRADVLYIARPTTLGVHDLDRHRP
jgi:hypothetical protein